MELSTSTDRNDDGRIAYLDYIKGIAILLVIFCHFVLLGKGSVLGNVLMILAWGAVPCFFMVSGGLLHQKKEFSWKKYIYRVLQVYFVLCIWKLIYLLITSLFQTVTFSKVGLITYLFFFGSIDGVDTRVMWFTQAYLLVLLVYPISWFLFHYFSEGKKILIFLMGLLFLAGPFINAVNFLFEIFSSVTGRNLLNLDSFTTIVPFVNTRNALLFFLLGAFLLKYKSQIEEFFREKARRVWIPVVGTVIGVIGLMLIRFWQTGTFRWNGTYLSDGYLWISTIVMSVGIYLLVQNYLARIRMRWLECIGKNTMGMYYIHYIMLAFLTTTAFWTSLSSHGSVLLNLIKTAVIALVCMLITIGLRKIPVIKLLVS